MEKRKSWNVFLPQSNFVFPITKRRFCYNWLDLCPWLAYSPVCDGAYCLFCVLFCNKVVTRKKKLVHLPYSDWSDAQAQFKRHVNAISGIHSESMENYSSFWTKWQLRWCQSMLSLFKQVNKPRRATEFYCQSLTFLKLLGKWTFLWGVMEMIPNIIQKLESRLPMLGLVIL